MLTVWDAIKSRRSIRKFLPNDIPDEMVEQMLEAARLAPSGSNRQPWRFVVARNKEIKKGQKHRLIGPGRVLEISFGDFDENDIIRYEDDYQRC